MMANPNSYSGAQCNEHDVTDLMRRVNALQATAASLCMPVKRLWPGGPFTLPASVTYPTNMAVDSSGNVYLAGYGDGGLEKWSPQGFRLWRVASVNGQSVTSVVSGADGSLSVDTPGGMYFIDATDGTYDSTYGQPVGAFDSSGNGYAARVISSGGFYNLDVYKYDASASFLTSWRVSSIRIGSSTGDGVISAADIDVSVSGIVIVSYITVAINQGTFPSVHTYTTSGGSDTTIGIIGNGSADGQYNVTSFNYLSATTHTDGYIYTVSVGRIQRFNTSGTFQEKFGSDTNGIKPVVKMPDLVIGNDFHYFNPKFIRGRNGFLYALASDGPYRIGGQTEWVAYKSNGIVSLGTPDGGVSVPALNGLSQNDALFTPAHLEDLRFAIVALSYLWGLHFFTVRINSATNASPIVVTLMHPIPVVNGNFVRIYGARGNTAANGLFQVANVNAGLNQFELQGSAGNGSYTYQSGVCALALDHLFVLANISRATDYGASDVSHGWWTRLYEHMCGPSVVVGSDGNDYAPYSSWAVNYDGNDYTPITGGNWADIFYATGTTGKGVAYRNYYYHAAGRSVVKGSTNNAYACIEDHFSTADTAPETGADWETYWVDLGFVPGSAAPVHAIGTAYSCEKAYDIDIGEIANCVAYLEANP